jgi:hypothetical protein
MQFGKHKGEDYAEIPEDYFHFLIAANEKDIAGYRAELDRRKQRVDNSYMARLVKAGYDKLIADPTNTSVDRQKLQHARDELLRAITDAGTAPKAGLTNASHNL